eukprot:420685_1
MFVLLAILIYIAQIEGALVSIKLIKPKKGAKARSYTQIEVTGTDHDDAFKFLQGATNGDGYVGFHHGGKFVYLEDNKWKAAGEVGHKLWLGGKVKTNNFLEAMIEEEFDNKIPIQVHCAFSANHKAGAMWSDSEALKVAPTSAHEDYKDILNDARKEYINLVADYEYDAAVETAREEKAERLLQLEKKEILLAKRKIKRHH